MELSYDDFFKWLQGSAWNSQISIILQPKYPSAPGTKKGEPEIMQALRVPAEIFRLTHHGLEKLVGNNLIVGSAVNSSGNTEGRYYEVSFKAVERNRKLDYQIFEVPDGQHLTDGAVLPLVARIKSGVTGDFKWLEIEYCAAALKYLK